MKKVLSIILTIVVVFAFCSFAKAEEQKSTMMGKGKMMGMMGKGDMQGMMAGPMMMGKSVVATPDGGVIVLMGNKLQKYDKDLALIKEVEIKIDTESMQKMMPMMGTCPSCPNMMNSMDDNSQKLPVKQ